MYDAIVMMMTMMIASAYYAIVIIMMIINIRVQCSRHDDDHPKVTLGFLKLSILKLPLWSEYELPLISEQWLE